MKENKENNNGLNLNRRQRRALKANNRKAHRTTTAPDPSRTVVEGKVVYHDDSFKDKSKRVFSSGMKQVKERLASMHKKFDLPEAVPSVREELLTDCIVINRDGHTRDLLPDDPGRHCILVHGNVARQLVSNVCMLVRVTKNEAADGTPIDGSWAIVPAEAKMMHVTTIQHVRRRPFWFLRRYHYEISFDGRVQPAHLFYDYFLDPTTRRQRMFITKEYVPVKNTDKFNSFFRFWKEKPE